MTSMISAAEAMGAEIDGRLPLAVDPSAKVSSYFVLLLLHLPFDYSTLWFLTNIKYIQYI